MKKKQSLTLKVGNKIILKKRLNLLFEKDDVFTIDEINKSISTYTHYNNLQKKHPYIRKLCNKFRSKIKYSLNDIFLLTSSKNGLTMNVKRNNINEFFNVYKT